jgi:amino acid adenylation domain-containing protein
LPPLERVLRDQPLPLSFAQQRLWFLDQLQPGGTFYNISAAIRLRGKLDVCALDRCLQEIIRRHEVLRTTFTSVDGRPVQVIRESHKAELPIVDLSLLTETERETEVQRLARREMEWSFDLEKDCLFRTTLLHLGPEENAILLTTHHIVSDGWSMGILVREVSALYEAFHAGNPSPLFELPIQYADYACWQCQVLSGAHLARQLDFWKKQLGDAPRALELPTDRPRPATLTFRGGTESLAWSSEFSQQLSEFSRKQGVTPFMTMLAAFQSLLHRYSGQADIVVGSAVANRTNSKTEKLIGFFVNTLVLRGRFSDDPTFSELLRQLRRTCLDAYDHQDVPFERLVEELHPPRDLSRPPLFQVGFAFQNIPLEQLQLTGISLAPVEVRSTTAKYDLTLTVTEERRGLAAYLEYNADLYDAGTIRRMLEHLRNLLGSALHDPEQPVSCLPLMSERERHQVLDEWNSTQIAFPRDLRVHEWFEMEVAKRPSSIALEFESHKLSYGELNRCANQLARQLRRQGLTRGALAGICMDRSLEMVIGLMAILKAGSAFVPLDPAYPSERLKYMIHDAALAILLTRESLRAHLFGLAPTLFYVDSARDAISCESDENLEVDGCPDDLAYVIYTSGSTGRPKGTMVQHRSLCNLAQAQIEAFHVGGGSRILQFSSLSFDASVWETVMALLSGGTLCLARREVLSTGQGLHRLLSDQRITTVTLPPSVLAVLPEQELPDLELIITAGEQCTADLVSRWGRGRRFFNAYGPTETTVCASMLEVTEHYPQGPPIGRPIANTKIYVLDAKWWPVPVGVPGELCVGGISVARGYLHRSDLTAEKFIPDPFSLLAGARLYKTGDQARYRPDGKIEFLGRMDDQVKVRGFRIELGEIAALLSAHPEVRDGMVIVREDVPGDRRIVAYVVTTRSSTITPADLRGYVAAQLPDHMVPAAFVFLPAMPLTPNGKIDRNALPSPDHASLALQNPYAAPRDRVEEKLAEITAHLLGIERVGIHDNFFDLGGHSLLATQFISQVRAALHVDLPLRSLFETPTVAGLAQRVMKSGHTDASTIEPEIQKLGRGDRKIEDLLAELGRMSDQEAQTLLAEEARRAEEGDRGR